MELFVTLLHPMHVHRIPRSHMWSRGCFASEYAIDRNLYERLKVHWTVKSRFLMSRISVIVLNIISKIKCQAIWVVTTAKITEVMTMFFNYFTLLHWFRYPRNGVSNSLIVQVALTLPTALLAERLRRYVQVVVFSEGVGSIPTECIFLPPLIYATHVNKKNTLRMCM
jgi:hypothetical protein